MRRLKNGWMLFFCIFWVFRGIPVYAQQEEDIGLYAGAAVLMDADSGRVLYEKNGDAIMAMASTTKIMTCIVVLENGNLDDTLQVSAYAASMPKVKLSMQKGEEYTVRDLLYSLMLESHNDSAVALAEHIGKTYLPAEISQKPTSDYTVEESKQAVAAFADLMNQKARDIGCENTWFITPNGLDATETFTQEDGVVVIKEHTTTASELARIMSYCIRQSPKKEEFLTITGTPSYSFNSAGGRSFSCANHNAFLSMMEGALSGKTGFTNKAGYCYVGALEKDGKTLIVALLACGWPNHKTYKWSDTRELMEYGLTNYTYHTFDEVAYAEDRLRPIWVAGGQPENLDRDAYTEVAILGRNLDNADSREAEKEGLLLKENERIEVECRIKDSLEAPIEKGTLVGMIYYTVEDKVYKTEQIVTVQEVEKIDYKWCMIQVFQRFSL